MKQKPPLTVTGMRWVVLILAIWNILRFGAALANWNVLQEFSPHPGPWYVLLTASFWTLACLAVWKFIQRQSPHAQGMYAITLYGYIAWWWADRFFISQLPRPNGVFAAVLTVILLIAIALDFFNPAATAYFTKRETYDQPKDQQSS